MLSELGHSIPDKNVRMVSVIPSWHKKTVVKKQSDLGHYILTQNWGLCLTWVIQPKKKKKKGDDCVRFGSILYSYWGVWRFQEK